MEEKRRWSDKDPILKEALELLSIQTHDTQEEFANEYLIKLQEEVAADVIEHVYDMIKQYQGKGNRWYDNDPVMIKAIEMLRVAPPKTQRIAALKLLLALEQKDMENDETTDE